MEFLQSVELTDRLWNVTTEVVLSKVKGSQLTEFDNICPFNTAKDGELVQKLVGIFPVKLLLLTLSAARFVITTHVEDGNCPANKLLEMLSTCSGLAGVEDGNLSRPPFRRLKLMSMTMSLLEDSNSCGRTLDSRL
uniref:Uncharacterized protein n=1 Tax=Oryza rufipogon TaxID=4529 RepID=A0A0E0NA09_ORYRU